MCMMDTGEMCRAILEDAELAKAFELDSERGLDFLEALLVAPDSRERVLAGSVLAQLRGVARIDPEIDSPPARVEYAPVRAVAAFVPALAPI